MFHLTVRTRTGKLNDLIYKLSGANYSANALKVMTLMDTLVQILAEFINTLKC